MRKLPFILSTIIALPVMGQVKIHNVGNQQNTNYSLSIKTYEGQSFWLFVDDVLQNENPVKSIAIQNMSSSDYYIRVEMNNNEHNCVGQFVNLSRPQSFEFAQRNGFFGLIAIPGGFRPELTMSLIAATPQNGKPLPPPVPENNLGMNHADFNQAKEQIRNESFDN